MAGYNSTIEPDDEPDTFSNVSDMIMVTFFVIVFIMTILGAILL